MEFVNGGFDSKVSVSSFIARLLTRDSKGRAKAVEQMDRQSRAKRYEAENAVSELIQELMYDQQAKKLRDHREE